MTTLEFGGFRLWDTGAGALDELWLRGGPPRSFLATDEEASQTLAHYHAQTWNGAELARALGVAQLTVRRYLDALTAGAREPWFWSTHSGAEIDLIASYDGKKLGIAVKRTDRPRITASTREAMTGLQLDAAALVHAGHQRFTIAPGIEAIPAAEALTTDALARLAAG